MNMGKRASLTTKDYLINAALPEATETYTVISHGDIINKTKNALKAKGFEIERELYKCNEGGQVAQGVYHLKYGNDPDMSMMFAWNNSYDKSMKFKCSIGGYVHASLATIIGSNMGSWGRKHTGSADNEAYEMIDQQIENAEEYFKQLVIDKESMKIIAVTEKERAEVMGRLYIIHEVLTGEQLALVKSQFNKPSFTYTGIADSLWAMYNGIIYSLQKAHPRTWMDQQRMIHWFLCDHFSIKPGILTIAEQNKVNGVDTLADPRQLNLIDEIEKIENEAQEIEVIEEPLSTAETSDETPMPKEQDAPWFDTPAQAETPISEMSPEVMQEEKSVEVEEEDLSWPCLGCNQMQGPNDVYYDGQLCTNCNSKS